MTKQRPSGSFRAAAAVRGLGILVAAAGMVVLSGLPVLRSSVVQAQAGTDWTLTGLTDPSVGQLFTPASGALFAQTRHGVDAYGVPLTVLMRSDDGGQTWRPAISSHGDLTGIAVDPNSHLTLYATGPQGLYKSTDDAQTFQVILPFPPQRLLAFAASAANPSLAYAAVGGNDVAQLSRTLDGGVTWQPFRQLDGQECGLSMVDLLQAHPTDQQRLFTVAGCYSGANYHYGVPLSLSTDQGSSTHTVLQVRDLVPGGLVGGQGVTPTRFYLSLTLYVGDAPGSLYRSDDNGETWTDVFDVPIDPSSPSSRGTISPPAYNPANPDQVYVAVPGAAQGILVSTDGGNTWNPLGQQPIGHVRALALGIDGKNLYAATDQGLWVYPVGGN